MDGKPLPLIEQINGKMVLNEDTLNDVFQKYGIQNIDVGIISIVGVERGAKSFTCNYIIRYLEKDDFGKDDQQLKGFLWKNEIKAQTKGVYIWSKPFIKTINNRKIAIIVMDTQGAFGNKTKDDGIIIPFSLSVSSLQIYNVRGDLNSNILQPFELYLRQSPNKENKLQSLVVFVKDWTLNNKFGFDGGKEYLLQQLTNQEEEDTYKYMNMYLNSISCYLWPLPGNRVSDPQFKGSLSELDPLFVKHLKIVVPNVIDQLIVGTHLNGMALSEHIRNCFKSIQTNGPLLSIVEANISNNLTNVINSITIQTKADFHAFLVKLGYNASEGISKRLRDIIEKRENIKIKALEEFEARSEQKGNIYELKLQKLEEELESGLNDKEKEHLVVLCYDCIRELKKSNGKELEKFVNNSFFGELFTRKSKIKQKSEELQKVVDEELEKYPQLKNVLNGKSVIDFADDLNKSLQDLKGKRIKTGVDFAFTGAIILTGGFLAGFVFGSGVAGAGAAAGRSAIGKEAVEVGAKFSAKRALTGAGAYGLIDVVFKFFKDIPKRIFRSSSESEENTSDTENEENEENEEKQSTFLMSIKELALIINRYVTIGGNVLGLIEQADETEKKLEKKGIGIY